MKLLKSHVQALELIYFMNPCHVRILQSLGGANIYKIQEKDKASAFYCDDLCKISVCGMLMSISYCLNSLHRKSL